MSFAAGKKCNGVDNSSSNLLCMIIKAVIYTIISSFITLHCAVRTAPALLSVLGGFFLCSLSLSLSLSVVWQNEALPKTPATLFQCAARENIKYIYSFAHVIYADYLNFLCANLWHITPELRIMLFSLFSFPLMLYCGWRLVVCDARVHCIQRQKNTQHTNSFSHTSAIE